VGKTTVLRLIDYCLGSSGKNIYIDSEFKKTHNTEIEKYLTENNVVITLCVRKDLEDDSSPKIILRRNFLSYSNKIQEINGEQYTNIKEYCKTLKTLFFQTNGDKPTFRQIISKNVRDEKSRLQNAVNVLHPTTKPEEYEALYLFWLGIELDAANRKQRLISQKKIEEQIQVRLRKESSLSQINQSLLIITESIKEITKKKNSFNINPNYESDLAKLNNIKSELNRFSTLTSRLELRYELIIESKTELEKEFSDIDAHQIKKLYEEAKTLIPDLQKTFEDTLAFHNSMVSEKISYITKELPELTSEIQHAKTKINELLSQEKKLSKLIQKDSAVEELQSLILELNNAYEKKGTFEEQKRQWENTTTKLKEIEDELLQINNGIDDLDSTIQRKIASFNRFFSKISSRLYGEQFVLSSDKNDKGYELNITSISGNLGTGKKKGQIAAFDLAYIQFADEEGIECLHFILNDQIENVHDNQITSLLNDVVNETNCQYILPVLRDKLPKNIDVDKYVVVSLSQSNKLFKI
jgi:uncharacterized protein YydD (DUF2326 family)